MSDLPGYITEEGTARYAARFPQLAPTHFRLRHGVQVSSIGIGTYLGENDAQSSANYIESIKLAIRNGCNLIDTAVNYRMMQSERDIGSALHELVGGGEFERAELMVCTKGGYIPYDGEMPANPIADLKERFVATKLAKADEIVGNMHCMAPDFLSSQIELSCKNLGLQTIDVYYLHNPEAQLAYISPAEFMRRLRRAFLRFEEEVALGRILYYGVSTWNGLRTDDKAREYLPLHMLINTAREILGDDHHFRFLQFPYSLGMLEALNVRNQYIEHQEASGSIQRTAMPLLAAAYQYGLTSITSAGLLQSQVLDRIPSKINRTLGDFDTDAQYALHFNRSTPGVTSTLVGMSTPSHVTENLAVAKAAPLTQDEFFEKLSK